MRVLALGRTAAQLCDELREDPRVTEAVAGSHAEGGSRSEVGEPTFDLVLHDCDDWHQDSQTGLPQVGERFLTEVSENGGVHVSLVRHGKDHKGVGHLRAISRDQSGVATPVIVGADGPAGIHLEPFLDSYGDLFGRQVLGIHSGYSPPVGEGPSPLYDRPALGLAVNQYDDVVITSGDESFAVIALARPYGDADEEAVRLLSAFTTRAIPALHPELLHGLGTSDAVESLRGELAEEIRRHREVTDEIEERLRVEEAFVARHSPLAYTQDEMLKLAVKGALQEVFGLEVVDLDEAFTEEKLADLYVPEAKTVIETRGSRRRNAQRGDVEGIGLHSEQLVAAAYDVSRRVLVFNGQLSIPASARAAQPFAPAVVTEALVRSVSLTTGTELLGWVIAAGAGDFTRDDLLRKWSQAGMSSSA